MPSSALQEFPEEPEPSTSSQDVARKNEGEIKDPDHFSWTQEIDKYGDKLLKRLDEFRKSSSMYDVRLIAQGTVFQAHKIVLAACGGMFRTCFIDPETKMMSQKISEINLNCPPEGVKPIMKFAYTGKLEITHRSVFAAYLAAEETDMTEVKEICTFIATSKFGWIVQDDEIKEENTLKLSKILSANEHVFKHKKEELSFMEPESKYASYVKENLPEFYDEFVGICKCFGKVKAVEKNENGEQNHEIEIEVENKVEEVQVDAETESETNFVKINGENKTDDNKKPVSDENSCKNEPTENSTAADKPPSPAPMVDETPQIAESSKPVVPIAIVPSQPAPKPTPPKVTPRKKSQESGDEGKPTPKPTLSAKKSAPKSPPRSPLPRRAIKSESSPMPTIRTKSPNRSSVKSRKAPEPPKKPPPVKSPMKKSNSVGVPPPVRPPAPLKNPPPRPRPPTIKRPPVVKPIVEYDDNLNPFADEDDESVINNAEKKETEVENMKDDYDDSLNPFA